jgi:hypothetical protein
MNILTNSHMMSSFGKITSNQEFCTTLVGLWKNVTSLKLSNENVLYWLNKRAPTDDHIQVLDYIIDVYS